MFGLVRDNSFQQASFHSWGSYVVNLMDVEAFVSCGDVLPEEILSDFRSMAAE